MNSSATFEASSDAVFQLKEQRYYGPQVTPQGVLYGGWFPSEETVEVVVWPSSGGTRTLHTFRQDDGFHHVFDPLGKAGDQYVFNKAGHAFPDPAARAVTKQLSRAIVIDPDSFEWTDDSWTKPAFRDLVIYELHVGTFTPEGTFLGIITKLPHLQKLGITAIQLMPLADLPGQRNWGYDGVFSYAPAQAYGTPDELRKLVNAAHHAGIAVLLDVVYNHLGPDGNYLPSCTEEFFSKTHETAWGKGFNFDGDNAAPVRRFFTENLIYWMEDFHIDGFRLDATHAIKDDSAQHILAEMGAIVHARGGYVIAEDERNEIQMLTSPDQSGFNFDAVWADDFHHSVRVSQTRDTNAYFQDFSGSSEELADILTHGWLYRGQHSAFTGNNRGTECSFLPPTKFIHCISNHDQVGNRALGDRLSNVVTADGYRALSALICFTPYTPMLFMGQEWAASTPFQFFTDHNEELGPLVTEGRRKEFAGFPEFSDAEAIKFIPDPQDIATFERSRLNWQEPEDGIHQGLLKLYTQALQLRHSHAALRPESKDGWWASSIHGILMIRYQDANSSLMLLGNLWNACTGSLDEINSQFVPPQPPWQILLSSNDPRFGGAGSGFDEATQTFSFTEKEVVLLKAVA